MSGTNNNTNIIKSTHCTLSQWRNTTSSNFKHYKAISANPQLRHPSKNKLKPKAKTMANFLTDVREILAREIKLITSDVDAATQEKLIDKIVFSIHDKYAGASIYLTKSIEAVDTRNMRICKKFNGRNLREIAREYDLCDQQIRTIIKKKRKATQLNLF